MHSYGVSDVEKLLRLSRGTIRALVKAGFVVPARGARRELRFSFQDLIVLRTAQALADAKVPAKRITRSLKELRRQLPEEMPLSGLSIGAVGDQVVVKDGAGRRRADSGQYLLAFEGDPSTGKLTVVEAPKRATAAMDAKPADDWYARAVALEEDDVDASLAAYEKAIAAEAGRLDAHINYGRLLHENGRLAQAEAAYRAGLRACGDDAVLFYNLGVVLEDLGRGAEALDAYRSALSGDEAMADCHYNLALLCERLGRNRDAIRHMAEYRRLVSA